MAPLPEQSSPRQGKTNVENRIFIKSQQPSPGSLLLHGGKRGLRSWGLHNERQSLGVLLWVQRDRQGRGQAGLRGDRAAGTRGWICPGQSFPFLPRLLQAPAERQLLSRALGLCALQRSLGRTQPPWGHPPSPSLHDNPVYGIRASRSRACDLHPERRLQGSQHLCNWHCAGTDQLGNASPRVSFHVPMHCKDI